MGERRGARAEEPDLGPAGAGDWLLLTGPAAMVVVALVVLVGPALIEALRPA